MVTANSCSRRPMIPPMNNSGMKTAARDSVIDRMVKPISPAPSMAACNGRLAHFHVADDVLQHDDGVIHDESDRQRQCHQRKIVEAVAQQVHHRESADDRHGQSQRRDDGGRNVSQEEEDHHDDQADGQQQGELHVVDRRTNGNGTVIEGIDLDRGGNMIFAAWAAAF